MRAVVMVVLVCSCSSKGAVATDGAVVDTLTIDADPCAASTAAVAVGGCVLDGLGQLDINGAWTLTGTRQQFAGSAQPYTEMFYITRTTGACGFEISYAEPPPGYMPHDTNLRYNDTAVSYSYSISYPHVHQYDWSLCVRDSDQALHYHSHSYVSMPPDDTTIDGVLTR